MIIVSKKNIQFQKLKKLTLKKYRELYQEFLIFGEHLIEEALRKGIILKLYTISSDKEGILISKDLMKELNLNKIVYSRCAICKKISKPLKSDKILVLDGVQDPGNVGTLLRSACSFGFHHIFGSFQTADFYNEKTIQSSQGSLFYLFLERGDVDTFLSLYKKNNYFILGTSVDKKKIDLKKISLSLQNYKKILVLGNEGSGISDLLEKKIDYFLHIETSIVESLNVSAAGSILMYLLSNQ
ncbi:MAG: RNA methyltransferase [Candidatus Phytoplasma stylosanthis]|uniref:TrmH family RNA methyltransferase n=1 Tax=Candidatus Phytoplasma stylosanthis TaxID=2798314 RepID=UPI002939D9B0|nr:RNA methyltransferase [Candidatus Phytoplasma stylosanthis]MDV3170819.1 RNA methyltransferase [Candidatus Phytoplasma stylosanthis]MDV3174167.1 RNA methyltransferase [Candidatus Phytoplasma stylosanthis]MDV3202542.1 RNA methyltransferase [Candidatus Phytoplasma stylosanthis]